MKDDRITVMLAINKLIIGGAEQQFLELVKGLDKNHFKLIWVLALLIGFSLACESFSAIREDFTETRSTVVAVATQAQEVITQAPA